jgi:hypothetical protein
MKADELARHDEALVAAATAEYAVVAPGESKPIGRRATDVVSHAVAGLVTRVFMQTNSIFNIWKDERGYWSTRRILLWFWTGLGFWAIWREVTARVYIVNETIIHPHFLGNAWIQTWMIVEGAFIAAVFGPVMVDYFKNAAPAMTAIGGALRDNVIEPKVLERRDRAAAAGSDGTEYTE